MELSVFSGKVLIDDDRLTAIKESLCFVPAQISVGTFLSRPARVDLETIVWIKEDQFGFCQIVEGGIEESLAAGTVVRYQSAMEKRAGKET